MAIAFAVQSAAARSGFPSPSKSPAAMGCPALVLVTGSGGENVPWPAPRKISTVGLDRTVTAKSGMPSRLKSAMAIDVGRVPAENPAAVLISHEATAGRAVIPTRVMSKDIFTNDRQRACMD